MEETIREQRERLRVTLSSICDAVIATGTDGMTGGDALDWFFANLSQDTITDLLDPELVR